MKLKQTIALVTAITVASLIFGLVSPASADTKSSPSKFLLGSLVNGLYLDGFSPGTPDYGFSLEALLQLSQYSDVSPFLGAAKNYLLKDTRIIGKSSQSGYAIDATTKKLNPAAAAKFAFVSAVVRAG
ncbi:MAG: hypothetical protein WCO24_00410, partial [Actinomycetes bacterium]